MTSAIDYPIRDLAPSLFDGTPIARISAHAMEQGEERRFSTRPEDQTTEKFILSIAKNGVAWRSPSGPAVRYGLNVVGYERGAEGAIITTVYELIFGHALRQYYHEVIGESREKPGRRKAWLNLKHQGTYCKHPPVVPTIWPRS